MSTYYSPTGNPEVWEEKPDGYFTVEEWQEMHPVPTPAPPTSDELMQCLRNARDTRLAATDKYLLADYPIGEADLVAVKAYRAALRNLPDQPGAPWDGGRSETPWPENPMD